MKVLHITFSSKGGAGIAALRLHKSLSKNGIQSAYLSINLTINFKNIPVKNSFFEYKKPSFFKKIKCKINYLLPITKRQKLIKQFKSLKTNSNNLEMISSPFAIYNLLEHPLVKQADVLNLHWVSGLIDYPTFFSKINKPIVWTLHDMNPFMGVFHYKTGTSNISDSLRSLNLDVEEIKIKSFRKINKAIIISPSKWLLEEAKRSALLSNFEMEKIANTIDFSVFKILNKRRLRDKYNISEKEFVLLFVADNLANYRKGFDLLLDAIKDVDLENTTIVTIGKGTLPLMKYKVISLGVVKSEKKMVEIYNLADVFILPSREDNLPNVILESFACGLPIISFNHGGMQEFIKKDFTGILVDEIDAKKLLEAIITFYNSRLAYRQNNIRNYAKEKFAYNKQYKYYETVYLKLHKNE